MKRFRIAICLVAPLLDAAVACAAEPPENPIHSQLISPELLIEHRDEVGLTTTQWERIRGHLEQTQVDAADAQRRLETANRALGELLGREVIDEPQALEQLDEVLKAEHAVKRLHLQAMIRIKNELTTEQKQFLTARVRQHARAQHPEDRPHAHPRDRLQSKLRRIQQQIERRAQSGRPPHDAIEVMQTFPELMQSGRHEEAEALLDRVLRLLDGSGSQDRDEDREKSSPRESTPRRPATPPPQSNQPARPADADRRREELSLNDIRSDVDALRVEDVAWRKIEWKTCLLDGLQASREQNKPLILWIFIDRPIDDERW